MMKNPFKNIFRNKLINENIQLKEDIELLKNAYDYLATEINKSINYSEFIADTSNNFIEYVEHIKAKSKPDYKTFIEKQDYEEYIPKKSRLKPYSYDNFKSK